MKAPSKTPVRETVKTAIIVVVAVVVLVLCIYAAMRLVGEKTESNDGGGDNLIVRAVDGDTLEMGSGEVIRLMCVDTPEEGEAGYEEAKAFLYAWISAENVRIERTGEKDKYNRTLAWIYSGESLVNKEIVDSGFGEIYEYNGKGCERIK